MASDLIGRKDLINKMNDFARKNFSLDDRFEYQLQGMEIALGFIEEAPTVDAVEVVHGEWIDLREAYNDVPAVKCSACGKVRYGLETNYCPDCGADMRGEKNASD